MYYLLAIALSLGLVVLYASTRPSDYRIARSLVIDAPPAALFARINDFHEWVAWSPWVKVDPSMNKTYAGPTSGTGAAYRWVGNKKVGERAMTILESTAPSKIEIELQFIKPFAATNKAIFTLEPSGAGTNVTWAMEGQWILPTKILGLFMNMDEMIGKGETGEMLQQRVTSLADHALGLFGSTKDQVMSCSTTTPRA